MSKLKYASFTLTLRQPYAAEIAALSSESVLDASTELVRRCPNLRGRCLSLGPHSGEGQARWPGVSRVRWRVRPASCVKCRPRKRHNKPHPPKEDKDKRKVNPSCRSSSIWHGICFREYLIGKALTEEKYLPIRSYSRLLTISSSNILSLLCLEVFWKRKSRMPESLFISLFTMQEIPSTKRKTIVGFPAVKRQPSGELFTY